MASYLRTALFVLLVSGPAMVSGQQMPSATDSLLNIPALPFSGTDMAGETYELEKLKGKTVVLNFWFIACPPCIREIPVLNDLKAAYPEDEVVFLGIALDDREDLEAFMQKRKFDFHLISDTESRINRLYGISAHPTTIVIDPQGLVRYRHEGWIRPEDLSLKTCIDKYSR